MLIPHAARPSLLVVLAALATHAAAARAQSVASVYTLLPGGVGSPVSVQAWYTGPEDSLMFDNLGIYAVNQAPPYGSLVVLDGNIPGPAYTLANVNVSGVLDTVHVTPELPGVNPVAVIHVQSYFLVSPAPPMKGLKVGLGTHERPIRPTPTVVCDSCKFAIIFSGGINGQLNHHRYWNDVKKKYDYKLAAGYCDTNITILYFDGNSKEPGVIPDNKVDPALQLQFTRTIDAMELKVRRCKAAGKKTAFQLLVTNHGDSLSFGGINVFVPADAPVYEGSTSMSPHYMKLRFKQLVDAGVDDVYAEFSECFGGGQIDVIKSVADSTTSTSFHFASASTQLQSSRAAYGMDVDEFEDAMITALSTGLSWSQAFHYADSTDRANYAAHRTYWEGLGVAQETPQSFERFAQRFRKSGEFLEVAVDRSCPTMCVRFPGADSFTRNANVTIECQTVNGSDTTWQVVAEWNWSVGKTKCFIPCASGTGRYRIVAHSNVYPTLVQVECGPPGEIKTPTEPPVYNSFSIGVLDTTGFEFSPHLGQGVGGSYFVSWQDGQVTSAIPTYLGAGYFDTAQFYVPLMVDPSRPWLYVGGAPTAPYVRPGIITIYTAGIFDPGRLPINSLPAMVHVSQPDFPSSDQFFYVTFTRDTSGRPQPVEIHLAILRADPIQLEISIPPSLVAGGFLEIDAIVLDPFGAITGVMPSAEPRGNGIPQLQSRPNPFARGTSITFALTLPGPVRVAIYDLAGRSIRMLADGQYEAGTHELRWDGTDTSGRRVRDGVYFCRLDAADQHQSRRLMLLR